MRRSIHLCKYQYLFSVRFPPKVIQYTRGLAERAMIEINKPKLFTDLLEWCITYFEENDKFQDWLEERGGWVNTVI